MGELLAGACSWTDKALLASGWYPGGAHDAAARLRHYARRFPVVEVDATYYALPSRRNSELWVERTPEGFVFDVKAFSLFTGHPARVGALPPALRPPGADRPGARARRLRREEVPPWVRDELWERFVDALVPLRDAGRLGCVLFQLPPWLTPDQEPGAGAQTAAELLAEYRERAARAGLRLAVEFRHPAWLLPPRRERTLASLRRARAALVAVDTAPDLPRSIPPVAAATSADLSVVRFHGRSAAWGTGSKEDRFRHRYTDEELRPWVPRIRALAEDSRQVHVLFNNCCGDAAVTAAERMRKLLDAP